MKRMSATFRDQQKGSVNPRLHGVNGQRGFSIVSAIFLLVVMASLGAFMLTFGTLQQTTSTQDTQGARAYQAARTGIEWGLYQALRVPAPPAAAPACPASPTTLPALEGALAGFTVTVECSSSDHAEAGNTVRVYQFTSTATNGVSADSPHRVERQLRVTVSR
jgi:MSHA biogenesis protein MshP